jgi:hypothetical protein
MARGGNPYRRPAIKRKETKKMESNLLDLNNHLFAEIERLNNSELTGEKLIEEIGRAKAVTDVAGHIIANGNLALNAWKAMDNSLSGADVPKPLLLE